MSAAPRARRIFLIATEASGDNLGAGLMAELRQRLGEGVSFAGIGGRAMAGQELKSLFPMEELSIIGFAAILKNIRGLMGRVDQAAKAVIADNPDLLVIIDGPEFTHRVAKRVRRHAPHIPIVDYVCPTVWAWRPWRARAMTSYLDQVMALFPFEPEAMKNLGGPPTTYVGHPLLDQIATLRPDAAERAQRDAAPMLVVLPGSRRGELRRLMPLFGATLKRILDRHPGLEVVLPTLPHLRDMVAALAANWPVQPRIVVGVAERQAAFRRARAALVKSGTVTLELALSGVPMAVAYRIAWSETLVAGLLLRVKTVVLANLVIGEKVVPEFIQHRATPGRLAAAVSDILDDGPSRQRQIAAFARLGTIMETGGRTPRQRAADIVEAALKSRQ